MDKNKQERVFEACDNLVERNQKITYDAIGQELMRLGYKKGSNTDIVRYKRLWSELNGSTTNPSHTIALPQPPDTLLAAFDKIRAEATRDARKELEEFQIITENKSKELNEMILYSQQEIDKLRQEKRDLEYSLNNQTNTLNITQEELVQLKQFHLETEQRSAKDSIEAKTNIDNLTRSNAELNQLIAKLLDDHKNERSDLRDQMEKQRHQYIAEIDALKISTTQLEKKLATTETENKSVKSQNELLGSRCDNMQAWMEKAIEANNTSLVNLVGQATEILLHKQLTDKMENKFNTVSDLIVDNAKLLEDRLSSFLKAQLTETQYAQKKLLTQILATSLTSNKDSTGQSHD